MARRRRKRNLKKRLRSCMANARTARGRGKCLAKYMKAKKRRR